MAVKVTSALREEQEQHYRLVEECKRAGIPTSLDDPRSPRTVEGLRAALREARNEQ